MSIAPVRSAGSDLAAGGPADPARCTQGWRRGLTWALAAIWLLDAALQYQPYMFTTKFPRQVIAPAGIGSPAFVNGPVAWVARLMVDHIVALNALFATIQLALALGLLFRRTVRVTLAASVLWAVLVWWLGEGLGGVLAGPVSPFMTLPGAVILYALIAVLIWPRAHEPQRGDSVADRGLLGRTGARRVWVLMWGAFAFEALRPGDSAPSALHGMVADMAFGEPGWLRSIDSWGATVVGSHGLAYAIVFSVLAGLFALAPFVTSLTRPALVVAILVALCIWVVGENFGQIATGKGTDPNTGPLLVLLALCYWPIARTAPSQRDDERA